MSEASNESQDLEMNLMEPEPVNGTEAGAGAVDEDAGEEREEETGGWKPDPEKLLMTLLFATNDFLSGRDIREIMGEEWDMAKLRQLIKGLRKKLDTEDFPFEIVEVDGTFRFRTRPQYYPWLRKLFKTSSNPRRLSQASLETLAIIAYKQPITKAEIEAIRGVNVDGCMKSLLDKKLVDIKGKSETAGSSFTYATTRDFMRYFGISKVPDDLPRLSDFEDIINSQALIPQFDDGSMHEMDQPEAQPEADD